MPVKTTATAWLGRLRRGGNVVPERTSSRAGKRPPAPQICPEILRELDTASWIARARAALAYGDEQTGLRPWTFEPSGLYPQLLESVDGCRVVDTAGRVYLDWLGGFGTNLLGYGCPQLSEALSSTAGTPSMLHRLEVEVAERLVAMIPCAESVAFGKNGSDAVSAAVRIARAATGRPRILQFGFHGFHDWFAGLDPCIAGIPDAVKGLVHAFPYGRRATLERLFDDFQGEVAAVVMEPFREEPPPPGYLEAVRALCHRHGALLVFDEIVTGLRCHRGGAQAAYGVTPDLACFGKALAGGLPLSALVGRRDLMALVPRVGVAMTFRGETLALAAARATLDILAREPVAEHVARLGESLRDGVAELAGRHAVPCLLVGHPSRLSLRFTEAFTASVGELEPETARGLLLDRLMRRGILSNGSLLPSWAHGDQEVDETLAAFDAALAELSTSPPSTGRLGGRPSAEKTPEVVSLGYLDSVRLEPAGVLTVEGWLLLDGRAAERVDGFAQVASADKLLAAAALPLARPDVAASVGGEGAMGFRLELPVGGDIPAGVALRAEQDGRVAFRCFLAFRDVPVTGPHQLAAGGYVQLPAADETPGSTR